MDWLRGSGGASDGSRGGVPPRQGQSPAPQSGRTGYSSVPQQYGGSNSSLPSYTGQQQGGSPALPSRSQRPPPQYNNQGGAMPGQMDPARSGARSGQFEVVPTPVDSLVPRNVSLNVSLDVAVSRCTQYQRSRPYRGCI